MYLKLKAMEAWRKYAISVRAALFFFKTPKQMKKEQVTDFLSDLKTRLARGELPKLLIASKMQSKGRIHFSKYTHVVLARDVVEGEDGNIRIYIWDGNFFAETLKSTPKYIAVTPRGELIYQPWFEEGPQANESIRLTRIEYAPENDYETVRELYSLKKFCEGENSAFCSQK